MRHRHQAHRRRTYGRRQHDLHQRALGPAIEAEMEGIERGADGPELEAGSADVSSWEADAALSVGTFPNLFASNLGWAQGRG